jgi:hypothetical protein
MRRDGSRSHPPAFPERTRNGRCGQTGSSSATFPFAAGKQQVVLTMRLSTMEMSMSNSISAPFRIITLVSMLLPLAGFLLGAQWASYRQHRRIPDIIPNVFIDP